MCNTRLKLTKFAKVKQQHEVEILTKMSKIRIASVLMKLYDLL